MNVRGRLIAFLAALMVSALTASAASAAPGELDHSFGTNGIAEFPGFPSEEVSDMAVQGDGKIVLAGTVLLPAPNFRDTYVARLVPQGAFDSSYGSGTGFSDINLGDPDQGGGLILLPDGRIQVSGATTTTGPGGGRRFVLAQLLNPQGTFDPAFGGGTGRIVDRYNILGTSGDADASLDAARQGSNTIIAGFSDPAGATAANFAVARISPEGVQDSSFGGGSGVSYADFFGGDDVGRAVAVQPDGKIVVVGVAGPGSAGGFIGVARFNSNGGLDSSFNGGGMATVQGSGEALAIQPDGKVVVAGTSGGDFIIARFNENGSLDSGFGSGGRAFIDFGAPLDVANDLALQPDGKILVAGSGPQFDVARLQPNGALDSTFGNGGKAQVAFDDGPEADALALQPDGNIVVAGSGFNNGRYLAVARLQGDPPGKVSGKCAGKKATIVGTSGKDKLKGTKKKDVVSAGKGKDTVRGLKGNDLICGGKGKDKLLGGPGKDKLLGQQGNDKLFGGPGKDKLKGGPGKKDKLKGGPGKDSEKP